jgi:hypothetical protein
MISYIWNKIKDIFKPEKQDPHLVLYEEVEKPKLDPCSKHIYFRKSCPVCKNLRSAGVI